MKLRIIILMLILFSFSAVSILTYSYYSSIQKSEVGKAHAEGKRVVEKIAKDIDLRFIEVQSILKGISRIHTLEQALLTKDSNMLLEANDVMDHYQGVLGGLSVCYLMDSDGNTIATSNRNSSTSFLEKNYAFRPYFKQAMIGNPSIFMALSITSKKRGVFFSYPVYGKKQNTPVGVVVIKDSIEFIRKEIEQEVEGVILLKDNRGVVFVSSREDWLYHVLWKVTPEEISEIAESKQFGDGPWDWVGVERQDEEIAIDDYGKRYRIHQKDIAYYPGWKIIYLHSNKAITDNIIDPFYQTSGLIIILLWLFFVLSLGILYKLASNEILTLQQTKDHK